MEAFMFLEDEPAEAPEGEERVRALEAECARLREELATVSKELASKTLQLSKRDQADRTSHEKWAQERATQLAATAGLDKDARIVALENSVRQLEATLAERAEELESAARLQSHYKQRAKEALAAAAEREADGVAEREDRRSAAEAAAAEELELLHQELARVRTRAAVEADVVRRELADARGQVAAAAADRERAVHDALEQANARWQGELDEVRRDAEQQIEELQNEVVRLRSAAEANLRAAAENHFNAELSSLNKAKVQVQRECEALRDMAAQAAAAHREEVARYMQENAALKARIASDAAAAAMAGRVQTGGKTFGARPGGGGDGAFERFVAELERRRRGLAPVLAVAAVCGLVLVVAIIRATLSGGGAACFLERLGVRVGGGCAHLRRGAAQAAAAAGGGGGPGAGLDSPVPRHKDGGANLRRLLQAGWPRAGGYAPPY